MLNLGPNPRFWAQIGPKITHFNKYRCNKAGKSSIYSNNECLSYNDIVVIYLKSIKIFPMLNFGPNPRFWAQIWPKIAYFNKNR